MTETEILPWYNLPGNPFITSLSPLMLSESGYSMVKTLKLGKNIPEKSFTVVYDRQFIIELIINLFIEPLEGIEPEEIFQIFNDAFDYYAWCKTLRVPDFMKSRADIRNYHRHVWLNEPEKRKME